ncbi:MAG: hypothetical protein JWN99_1853, partial [Ilumatobacteraceae bacterium]|nr:hypothetical protein [Ilumatobacteraceae bacterium]
MTFDPVGICAILNEEAVDYVIVGGFAAVVHGSSLPTRDIDLVPSRTPSNLDRLARALKRMNAMIRTAGDPVATRLDAPFLANMPLMVNLVTDFGEMDLTFCPSGGLGGFDEWDVHAIVVEISDGLSVHVASLNDIIDSKRAADR